MPALSVGSRKFGLFRRQSLWHQLEETRLRRRQRFEAHQARMANLASAFAYTFTSQSVAQSQTATRTAIDRLLNEARAKTVKNLDTIKGVNKLV
jgi:hypothetical protein